MSHAKLNIVDLRSSYGDKPVLDGVSFEVGDGELVAVLGPSGCGKTTLLKTIAGLLPVSGGSIEIDGVSMEGVPSRERNAPMVFQHYALFPHMSVADNIAYGLKVRGRPKQEREKRVEEVLSLVDLQGFGQRAVHTLSGGQQQRVAMGRALAIRPDVLLLDEPLSSLDERLRTQMRHDLRTILKTHGATTLYVTHDQDEAMELADRIVVMKAGRVEQIAPPLELYRNPATEYVARFLGHANVIEAELVDGRLVVLGASMRMPRASGSSNAAGVAGKTVRLLIPGQSIRILPANAMANPAVPAQPPDPAGSLLVPAVVHHIEYRSGLVRFHLRVGDVHLVTLDLDRMGLTTAEAGTAVMIEIDLDALRILR
jgi:putative spermidine/putrescine transport system ATP-binding protein